MRTRTLTLVVLLTSSAFALPAAAEPPAIEGVYPSIAQPGDKFRVVGTGFDGVENVTLGGVRAVHGGDRDNGTLYVVVPDLAPGEYRLTVTDDEGSASWCCFQVTARAPVVEHFAPERAPPGTWVDVSGRNLDMVHRVDVGSAGAVFHASPGSLTFRIPDLPPASYMLAFGWAEVHATGNETGDETGNATGGTLLRCCLTVVDPKTPRFDALQPGTAAPYDVGHLTGENLGGLQGLWVGERRAEVLWADPWSVQFRVPDLSAGSHLVEATFGRGNLTWEYASICCLVVDPGLPRPDLAVDILGVAKSTIRTDLTSPVVNPVGTQTLTVEVANRGTAAARPGWLEVVVEQDGLGYDATHFGEPTPWLEPGESVVYTFEWSPGDVVGDATVRAQVFGWDARDPSNDRDDESTFVLVGGLGSANVPLVD